MTPLVKIVNEKIKNFTEHPILFLSFVGIIAALLRFQHFPYDIAITLDGLEYLAYAFVTSKEGHFPQGWQFSTNGWPSVLSVFFSLFPDREFMDYVNVQRCLTLIISISTIFPMYLLGTRFFSKQLSLLCAIILVLHPMIIKNSISGLPEPLFILLGILTLYFFLSSNSKSIYASFATASFMAIIRYEGLLALIPLSGIFFMRFKINRNSITKYFLCLSIILLILLPTAFFRIEATGRDGMLSHVLGGPNFISKHLIQGEPEIERNHIVMHKVDKFLFDGVLNTIKYLGYALIPNFICLIIISFIIITKKRKQWSLNYKIITILAFTITFLIPAFYAYARGFDDPKYLFIIFPIFSLLSVYSMKKISIRFSRPQIVLILFLFVNIVASGIYLEFDSIDNSHEKEAFLIAKQIVEIANGVNGYPPETRYIKSAELLQTWPNMPTTDAYGHLVFRIVRVPVEGFNSLEEFIHSSEDLGLTHLVLDGKPTREKFLNDVYHNEKQYPYLLKVYDSHDQGFSYRVKIFKINYDNFVQK